MSDQPTPRPSLLKKPSSIPQGSRLPTATGIKRPTVTPSISTSESSQSVSSLGAKNEEATPNPPTSSLSRQSLGKLNQSTESLSSKTPVAKQDGTSSSSASASIGSSSDKKIVALENSVKDLTEKLETLKLKRAEDREKLREAEKQKLQIQQLQEFKTKAQELMSNTNKELQQAKQDCKTIKDQFDAYRDEMSNHEQRLEEVTVDKELAEAKIEELQDEILKLNEKLEEVKLELDVLKSEIEINGVEGAAKSFQSKQMEKEAETLKAALIKLRDLSLQDKNDINILKKQNEELSTKFKNLMKECETLKNENSSYVVQINELKDQVTATLGSVQMIEQLTEQNLDLEAKIMELKETIQDLEDINEVNDQLQENAREEEKELRQNLDLAESRIRESEKQIEYLKYNIADHEKTIVKFRDLVKQLQSENDSLNRKLKTTLEEQKALSSSSQSVSNYDFKQKFIDSQNQAKVIENEVNKLELQSMKRYNTYLLSYMSDFFVKRSGDNECILSLVFFKRIASKCDLILNHFTDKINNASSNGEINKANQTGQFAYFNEISIYLSFLKLLCNKYDHVLNTCDLKVYTNIGQLYFDFNLHEKSLDSIIELLQRDQLDESVSIEALEKSCIHFQAIFKNYLNEEKIDVLSYLEDLVKFGTFSCESISIDLQRLNSVSDAKDDTSEIILLFKELSVKNEEMKAFVKKVQRNLPKDDKLQKKVLILPADLCNELENCVNNFQLLVKTLKELYNLAANSKMFSSSSDGSESLSAKKLENLAYQACDKIYLKDDNGPFENLRNSINQMCETFGTISISLENGEYETELTDEEYKIRKYQVNSPITIASEQFKNALIEAESIKIKLETKEEEIKEVKKHLKAKADELSEQKVRISLIEKKAEDAHKELEDKNKKLHQSIEELKTESAKKEKEHLETLEAMQQEIDALENERKELKEKLRSTSKKNIFDTVMMNRQISESVNEAKTSLSLNTSSNIDSSAILQELKTVRNLNKVLQKNYNDLKQEYAKTFLMNLPSLPNQTVMKNLEQPIEPESEKPKIDNKDIFHLAKQSNDLMKNVYTSFANVKVQNLKDKKRERPNSILGKAEIQNLYLTKHKIQNKIINLQREISDLNPQNPDTKESVSHNKNLVAEICLRTSTPGQQQIDLDINYDELKELFRRI